MITEGRINKTTIVKNYWKGGINKGINMTVIKEKKIDIINGYNIIPNSNAKET